MIRDEDAAADRLRLHRPEHEGLWRLRQPRRSTCFAAEARAARRLHLQWSGEYEFELRAKERLKIILPVVFFVIFLLLYMVFHSVTEALVLIFPDVLRDDRRPASAVAARLQLQRRGLGRLHRAVRNRGRDRRRDGRLSARSARPEACAGSSCGARDIEEAAIEGAVQRLRPKLMTVAAVLASLVPILWETGIGSDVMKPIAAPIVGGMITSTIHVLILVPVFFVMMKERALRQGKLHGPEEGDARAIR